VSYANGKIGGRRVDQDALGIVMFHVASHAPDFLMELMARLLECVADGKRQIGIALVRRWNALDIHFLAFRQNEADMHLIEATFAVVRTGRLYHDSAGRYAVKALVKLRYMRSDHFLDLRRPLHALKLDFRRSFHIPHSGSRG
jgi:hypothetical protein